MIQLLLVEDSEPLRQALQVGFASSGQALVVDAVASGEEAVRCAQNRFADGPGDQPGQRQFRGCMGYP